MLPHSTHQTSMSSSISPVQTANTFSTVSLSTSAVPSQSSTGCFLSCLNSFLNSVQHSSFFDFCFYLHSLALLDFQSHPTVYHPTLPSYILPSLPSLSDFTFSKRCAPPSILIRCSMLLCFLQLFVHSSHFHPFRKITIMCSSSFSP